MSKPKNILVIRFSAMGDVALTIPALLSVVEAHPQVTLTVITRPFYASFIPSHKQITVISIDIEEYRGVFKLRKLAKELIANHQIDQFIDLHNVLRSKIITSFLKLKGIEGVTFDKKRTEKRAILSGKTKKPLPHIIEQYVNTFALAGYPSKLIDSPWIVPNENDSLIHFLAKNQLTHKDTKWIGIAPFAAHEAKTWGMNNIQELISKLIKKNYSVFLFGGGKKEIEQLDELEDKKNRVFSVAGKIPFDQELAMMKKLDALVCMDSSNMHFGCLLGIKVISIWGATTPLLGFYPYGNEEFILEVPHEDRDKLTLSGYGNKTATNGYDWRKHISINQLIKLID